MAQIGREAVLIGQEGRNWFPKIHVCSMSWSALLMPILPFEPKPSHETGAMAKGVPLHAIAEVGFQAVDPLLIEVIGYRPAATLGLRCSVLRYES